MHKSKILFRVSDVVNHPLRNYKRYPEVRRVCDIPYGDGSEFRKMDVYFSPARKKAAGYPVLFNIHGGGFVAGGKKYRSGIARYFADRGWFVVNVDYALAPESKYPEGLKDCMSALNAVNGLKDKYSLDLTRLVISGDSAGGYYAAQLVAAVFDDGLRRTLGADVYNGAKPRALLTFCAPFDPSKCLASPRFGSIAEDIAECLYGKVSSSDGRREFERGETDAVANVNSDWCECFMVEAERDGFCGGQLRDMTDALRRAGVPYGFYVASEKKDNHCTHLFPFLKGSAKTLAAVCEFLDGIAAEGAEEKLSGTVSDTGINYITDRDGR